VLAHSNDYWNEAANTLAQNHQTLPILEFKHSNLYNLSFHIKWENVIIENSARKLIKTICNAHIIATWSSQNRNQTWAHLYNQIDWNSTWLYLNNNKKRSHKFTNFKLSKLKTFRIKLLHNELPTPIHLHKYYPNLILNNKCFKCNQTDTELHWITKHNSNTLQEIISQSVTEILNTSNLEITQSQVHILQNLIIQHSSLQLSTNSLDNINLYTSLKGLLPHTLVQTIQLYTNSLHIASQITIKLFLKINLKIYEQLWLPYCSEYANWKQQNNIRIPHSNSQQNRRNNQQTIHSLHEPYNSYSPPPQHNQISSSELAIQKISAWPIHWIKYGLSTNFILSNQI
jgi:hypothetical protein